MLLQPSAIVRQESEGSTSAKSLQSGLHFLTVGWPGKEKEKLHPDNDFAVLWSSYPTPCTHESGQLTLKQTSRILH